MRGPYHPPFFDEDFSTTNSAPSGASDGADCRLEAVGGNQYNADSWTVVCLFTGTGTTATITPYVYVDGAWVSGASYDMKKALDADGVTVQIYHDEHSELM